MQSLQSSLSTGDRGGSMSLNSKHYVRQPQSLLLHVMTHSCHPCRSHDGMQPCGSPSTVANM